VLDVKVLSYAVWEDRSQLTGTARRVIEELISDVTPAVFCLDPFTQCRVYFFTVGHALFFVVIIFTTDDFHCIGTHTLQGGRLNQQNRPRLYMRSPTRPTRAL